MLSSFGFESDECWQFELIYNTIVTPLWYLCNQSIRVSKYPQFENIYHLLCDCLVDIRLLKVCIIIIYKPFENFD